MHGGYRSNNTLFWISISCRGYTLPTFQGSVLHPSSGRLKWYKLLNWHGEEILWLYRTVWCSVIRRRQYVPPKRREIKALHDKKTKTHVALQTLPWSSGAAPTAQYSIPCSKTCFLDYISYKIETVQIALHDIHYYAYIYHHTSCSLQALTTSHDCGKYRY